MHAFVNDLERGIGTYLYGRRMYETMRVWQDMPVDPDDPSAEMADYAEIWRGADKVVYSSTLAEASTPRTRILSRFEPDAVRELAAASDRDVSVGGPTLAAEALPCRTRRRGDAVPRTDLGRRRHAGTPRDLVVPLALLDERRFGDGTVFLHYRVL